MFSLLNHSNPNLFIAKSRLFATNIHISYNSNGLPGFNLSQVFQPSAAVRPECHGYVRWVFTIDQRVRSF